MRRAVVMVVLSSLIVVGTTTAADPNPRALVLRSSDVPTGFALDRGDTGIRTNEEVAGSGREGREQIARMGRVTGYAAVWERDRGQQSIASSAHLFHRAVGARMFLSMVMGESDKLGIQGLRRTAVRIGDQGRLLHGGPGGSVTWVVWRSGRAAALVTGWGLARDTVLALARKQQRRMAVALR